MSGLVEELEELLLEGVVLLELVELLLDDGVIEEDDEDGVEVDVDVVEPFDVS